MPFLVADTFTKSLGKLGARDQKQVKTAAFDLQMNPERPGLHLEKLAGAADPGFRSARVNADLRIILHQRGGDLLLCYAAHHDDAYAWAKRRKLEAHPTTGAAQLVEVPEAPAPEPAVAELGGGHEEPEYPPLFAELSDAALLGIGVPDGWQDAVRRTTMGSFFDLAERLPEEAGEALLEYVASGTLPTARTQPADADADDPFAHPDAQRRFRAVDNLETLKQALEYPWEQWTVFLHPAQEALVTRRYTGPARVMGSAGTGKTVVALHRALHLARRDPEARVLLATFDRVLSVALRQKLARLIPHDDPARRRITVSYVDGVALSLYQQAFGREPQVAADNRIEAVIAEAAEAVGETRFSTRFLVNEWRHVVDAWQLRDWESYRDVPRLGRRTRIGARQREALWRVFAHAQELLDRRGLITWARAVAAVTRHYAGRAGKPYDHAVVDEAQDIAIPQLRFLDTVTGDDPDALFFAGDLGQRIFQQPFSWLSQGVDVRGRSTALKVNYRTSHQIRRRADRLLPGQVRDVDGEADDRRGTVSVFDGPEPEVTVAADAEAERDAVAAWLERAIAAGAEPGEIGVFVRTREQLDRAKRAVEAAGERWVTLAERGDLLRLDDADTAPVPIGTMHMAKGQEVKAVAVMACDDEAIPLQARIETCADESDLDEVFAAERHLLYVALTRARDRALVSGVTPGSEFLEDLAA